MLRMSRILHPKKYSVVVLIIDAEFAISGLKNSPPGSIVRNAVELLFGQRLDIQGLQI